MKIKINYWEQHDCIQANRVLKILAASFIGFCAKDCWLIVHHVPEKGRELSDMRIWESESLPAPSLYSFFFLDSSFFFASLNRGNKVVMPSGFVLLSTFTIVFPLVLFTLTIRERAGCSKINIARCFKKCSCVKYSHWSSGGEGVLWWSTQNGCREKRGFCIWKVRETPFLKLWKHNSDLHHQHIQGGLFISASAFSVPKRKMIQ